MTERDIESNNIGEPIQVPEMPLRILALGMLKLLYASLRHPNSDGEIIHTYNPNTRQHDIIVTSVPIGSLNGMEEQNV